jgi:hypothetical protein
MLYAVTLPFAICQKSHRIGHRFNDQVKKVVGKATIPERLRIDIRR